MKKFFLICLMLMLPLSVDAKRGCCSWHGGVSHCGDNGKYVCNDGTYSPSCTCTPTITYKYGCTNSNAINYDSSADRDDGSCILKVLGCMNKEAINYNSNANTADGSCQFEVDEINREEIAYETIYEDGEVDKVKQEGKVGYKEITTRIVKDESGNIISTSIVDEKTVEEPINEIIIKKVENDTVEEEDSNTGSGIFSIGIIGGIAYAVYKKKKKKSL